MTLSPLLRFPTLVESGLAKALSGHALKLPPRESDILPRDKAIAVAMAVQSAKSGMSGTCALEVWEAISRPGTRYTELFEKEG